MKSQLENRMAAESTNYVNLNDPRNPMNITNSFSLNRLSQTSFDFDQKNPGYSLNEVKNQKKKLCKIIF